MKYRSLKKIYYTDINNYKIEYKKRFEAITTKHFSIEIKQYNREKAYPAFLCYTEEIMLLVEKFYKNYFNLFKMNCQSKCDTSFKNKLNGLSQFKHFLGLLFNNINFFIKSSLDIFPKSVFFG